MVDSGLCSFIPSAFVLSASLSSRVGGRVLVCSQVMKMCGVIVRCIHSKPFRCLLAEHEGEWMALMHVLHFTRRRATRTKTPGSHAVNGVVQHTLPFASVPPGVINHQETHAPDYSEDGALFLNYTARKEGTRSILVG